MDKRQPNLFAEIPLDRPPWWWSIEIFKHMSNEATLKLRKLLEAGGLPELGPGPREGVAPLNELNAELDELLSASNLSEGSQRLVRGLILLWHDHMEPAHEIAQAIENSDGSFLHGILHRREPDYGNAGYWFRRVGRHRCFPEIAKRTGELLQSRNELTIQKQLIRNGDWDAFGFIDACEKASVRNSGDATVKLLREIQGIETEVLLEEWAAR